MVFGSHRLRSSIRPRSPTLDGRRLLTRKAGSLRSLFDKKEPRAVPLLHLCDRAHPAAKGSELSEFPLNGLQPFVPLAVSDLSLRIVRTSKPINPVQFLNLSDLCLEKPDLFTENF